MHPDIHKLLEVQRVDQVLARIRRDLDSLPAEEERRRTKLDKVSQLAEQTKKVLGDAELRTRDLDLSIKQAENELKNLEVKLNNIKNNAEYQAILFQMESVKKERSGFEDESLAVLENMDQMRADVEKADKKLADEQKIFGEFQQKAETLRTERSAELAEASAGRDDMLQGVTPEVREEYERLFDQRGGLAVAAVEGRTCQGCYTDITVNDLARLQGASSVVRCGSCQRLLYLPS